MSTTTRLRALTAFAVIGLLLNPIASASALTELPVTTTITNSNTEAATGDTVDVKIGGVTTEAGASTQGLTGTWDPKSSTLNSNPVAPQDWTLEYLDTRDSTWTATKPPVANIGGVRANGPFNSLGTDDQSRQISIGSAVANPPQQVKTITVTGAGDGYDVFFDPEHTQIFNVFHHSSPAKIDCHLLTDGSRCAGFPVALPNSLGTNERSTGYVIGTKAYIPAGFGSSIGGGFACVNTTGGLCATPFYKLTSNVSSSSYNNVINVNHIGTKLYTQNKQDGRVLCLDTAIDAACADMPVGGYDVGLTTTSVYKSNLLVTGGKLYVGSAGLVGCLDPATGTTCSGWDTLWNPTPDFSVMELPNGAGQIIAICTFNDSSAECIEPTTRAAVTPPASFITALGQAPVRSGLGGYPNTPQTVGSRVYWADSSWDRVGKIQCFDASLNDSAGGTCANFPLADENYTVVVDPTNSNCIWTNDNSGSIEAFNATTGASGCAPSSTKITFNGSAIAPRMACDEPGRIEAWRAFTLGEVTGGTYTSATLTILNSSGGAIAGWSDVAVVSGRVDLSALSVADTGTNPKFVVTFAGEGSETISAAEAGTEYVSGVPELCVQLIITKDCPVIKGHGPSTDTTWSRDPIVVSASGDITIAGTTSTITGSSTTNRTATTGCLGGIAGKTSVGLTGANLAGITVNVLDSDLTTVLATTTTDANGNYLFENYIPGSYSLNFGTSENLTIVGDANVTAVVPSGSNVTADGSYQYGIPTATNVTSSGYTNKPQILDPLASVNIAAGLTLDATSLQLYDTATTTWKTTLTIENEGTYVVDPTDHKVTFTPAAGFNGTATPVAYRASDSIGQRANANITVTVSAPPAPAPAGPSYTPIRTVPLTGTDVQGKTQSFDPVAAATPGTNASVVIATVRLISNGELVTAIVKPGEGTWNLDLSNGQVFFTPLPTFVGTATPVSYRIGDSNGTATISTITATVTAKPETKFSIEAGMVTTPVDVATTVDVTGVPAGATVALGSGVRGVGTAVYTSGVIAVTPSAGFSGIIRLPVAATLDGRTERAVATITVVPAPARNGSYARNTDETVMNWAASSTPTVTSYRVYLDGVLVCETSSTTCATTKTIGGEAKLVVRAVGGDDVVSADMIPTPAATTVVAATPGECSISGAVYFDTAKWALTAQAKATLNRVAAQMRANGTTNSCIVGHTDNRGSVAYNDKLSRNRVNAVYAYLGKLLPGVRFAKSFDGELKPAAKNDAPSKGMAKNRRVEIGLSK